MDPSVPADLSIRTRLQLVEHRRLAHPRVHRHPNHFRLLRLKVEERLRFQIHRRENPLGCHRRPTRRFLELAAQPSRLHRSGIPRGYPHRWFPSPRHFHHRRRELAAEEQPRFHQPTVIRRHASPFLCPNLNLFPTMLAEEARLPRRCWRVHSPSRCARPNRRLRLALKAVVERLRFRLRPAMSRGHVHCRRLAPKEEGEQRPTLRLTVIPREQRHRLNRLLHPQDQAAVERSLAGCSKTTNSKLRRLPHQNHSAPTAAVERRPHRLRPRTSRDRSRRQCPLPAWMEAAAPRPLPARRTRRRGPNVPPTEEAVRPHRQERGHAVRRPNLPAAFVLAAPVEERRLASCPCPDFQVRDRLPAPRAEARSRLPHPARAMCDPLRSLSRQPAEPPHLIAANLPSPWYVRLDRAVERPPN